MKTTQYGSRKEWLDSEKKRHLTAGVIIDSTKVRVDANSKKTVPDGMVLGKITATGKYAPLKATRVTGGAGATQASCVVEEVTNFQVGDEVTIGANTKTITAIDYVTKTISWTGDIVVAEGDVVKSTDGSGVAAAILAEHADLTDGDGKFGAIDWARVREARLPIKLTAASKAELNQITFV